MDVNLTQSGLDLGSLINLISDYLRDVQITYFLKMTIDKTCRMLNIVKYYS